MFAWTPPPRWRRGDGDVVYVECYAMEPNDDNVDDDATDASSSTTTR